MEVSLQIINDLFTELNWPAATDVTQLHGDASARRYFRMHRTGESPLILMAMPEGAASASEEITNYSGTLNEPPFIHMTKALASAGLPVPHIHHYDEARRWIVLDDLGDTTLYRHLHNADRRERIDLYRQAIDLLCAMQSYMAAGVSPTCLAHERSFDTTLLDWEFEHFAEYALAGREHALDETAHAAFSAATQKITQTIIGLPQSFVHRDFQSKNLMWVDDDFVLIDYQDALTGSYVYDLVALLRDSYVVLSPQELETLLEYFAEQQQLDLNTLRRDFYLQTLQRKMKDAGRFVYIEQVRGNPDFMQYFPDTLAYVQHAFAQLPEYYELYEALIPYVPEWQ